MNGKGGVESRKRAAASGHAWALCKANTLQAIQLSSHGKFTLIRKSTEEIFFWNFALSREVGQDRIKSTLEQIPTTAQFLWLLFTHALTHTQCRKKPLPFLLPATSVLLMYFQLARACFFPRSDRFTPVTRNSSELAGLRVFSTLGITWLQHKRTKPETLVFCDVMCQNQA